MGRWEIEGLEGPALCFPKAKEFAWRVASAQGKDVIVRYIGRRDNPNKDPTKSDFVVHRDGLLDFRIDPTWAGY